MVEKQSFSVLDILKAAEAGTSIGVGLSDASNMAFGTAAGRTLGPEDASKIERLVEHVQTTYNTQLTLIGGGLRRPDELVKDSQ